MGTECEKCGEEYEPIEIGYCHLCYEDVTAELSQCREAIGLLTTLHPTMEINPDDPAGMAMTIERHVTAERDEVIRHNKMLVDAIESGTVGKQLLDRMDAMKAENQRLLERLELMTKGRDAYKEDRDRLRERLKLTENSLDKTMDDWKAASKSEGSLYKENRQMRKLLQAALTDTEPWRNEARNMLER